MSKGVVSPVAVPGFAKPSAAARGDIIVMYAVEGWGKTTLGAYAEGSAIIMADGETGYITLYQRVLVPERPCVTAGDWRGLLALLNSMADDPHPPKVLVLDAVGGFERLCHAQVCKDQFEGDWGEKGFLSYHRGYDVSIAEWLKLLAVLERLRSNQGTHILMLGHAKVRPFKNPMGPDYDRFVCDCHDKTWGVTHKWADAVLFGNFFTVVETDSKSGPGSKKGKGVGGTMRVIYTTQCDAFAAKNRFGLPEQIDIKNDPAASWPTLASHLWKAKNV